MTQQIDPATDAVTMPIPKLATVAAAPATKPRPGLKLGAAALAIVLVISAAAFITELVFESNERKASVAFNTATTRLYDCTTQVRDQFNILPGASAKVEIKVQAAVATAIAYGSFGPPILVPRGNPAGTGLFASRAILREATGGGWRGTYDNDGDIIIARIEESPLFQNCSSQFRGVDESLSRNAISGWIPETSFDEHLTVSDTPGAPPTHVGLAAFAAMQEGPRDYVLRTQYGCIGGPPTGLYAHNCAG